MVTVDQANEYLNVVGRLIVPDADDRTWVLVIANAVAGGLIPSVDWDSTQGANLMSLIAEVFPDYQEWLADEGILPADIVGA
jgi:hypothetical protein